ncbi:hypothetical protein BH24CHL1_BH24CHL1_05690 [soil metagenome]
MRTSQQRRHVTRLLSTTGAPIISGLIFLGFLMLRLPFRSHYPANWDAVQLALGTQAFDLHHHQPHPPGYIGFIGLGWLMNHITGDPNTSLTILSMVAGSLAPALLYLFALRFMSRGYALVTAALFGLSPLVWYYSEVALTYAAEAAAGIAFLAFAHRGLKQVSTRDLIVAAVLLSVLGSLRQSAMLFLIPVWLYAAWQFPWRVRIGSAAVLGVTSLLWVVPLLWLSGGPNIYMEESRALANVIGASALSLNVTGLQMNVTFVIAGILIGANAGLLIAVAARLAGVRPLKDLDRKDKLFFLLWVLPAMVTFILGHTGQLGYILLLLPALFLLAGVSLEGLSRVTRPARLNVRRPLLVISVTLFAAASAFGFLALPGAAYTHFQSRDTTSESNIARHLRQYDLKTSDAHWEGLAHLIGRYDPRTTVVLTTVGGPRISGSFRHVSYLLPEYRVYGLGMDTDGSFGYMFTAQHGRSDYSVEGLASAAPWLPFGHNTLRVIIPDSEILSRLDPRIARQNVTLPSGANVVIAFIPSGTAFTFYDLQDSDE